MYEDIIEIGRLRQELAAAQYRAHVAEQRVKELERSQQQQSSESGLPLGRWRTRSGTHVVVTQYSPDEEYPFTGTGPLCVPLSWTSQGKYYAKDDVCDLDLVEYLGNAD